MSQHVRPSNCSNKMAGCMDASKAAESRQLRARAKKMSRYLHLSARVDFPFKACESHQQHFSALASFANVLAFCTCVLPISYVGVKVPVIDLIP